MTGEKSLDRTTFKRLSRLYTVALSAVALSIIVSQALTQRHLISQLTDSRVVNVAGRQRMLSQKISKEALLLATQTGTQNQLHNDLKESLELWQASHNWLQFGADTLGLPGDNSTLIQQMFREIQPYYTQIKTSAHALLLSPKDTNEDSIRYHLQRILTNEPLFLNQMDKIVFQFDEEAQGKVESLRRKELWLLLLALSILALEIALIFRPAAVHVRNTISKLIHAEKKALSMTEQLQVLYQEKEQSLQELRSLNFALDQTALFASITKQGELIYLSKKFRELLDLKDQQEYGNLIELMTTNEGEQQYLMGLIEVARSTIWTGEVTLTTTNNQKHWLEMSIVPVNRKGVLQDLLILCSDITTRKLAQSEIDQLKELRFEEEIRQQKIRSIQVVEAQEEERKRIAREIHDGIGQMLTALRFNLQAIDLNKTSKAKKTLETVMEISSNLIKGIRIATFNLTPPELADYGIAPALAKLASELEKLTGEKIIFHNRSNCNQRFDSIVETNLYRITQEAVNNAIKYANANFILITLSHTTELLSISVEDDGAGFDPKTVEKRKSIDGSGMGLSFMQERVQYINGRLFIRSTPNKGTKITINMPIGS